jgi:hypothetical protein
MARESCVLIYVQWKRKQFLAWLKRELSQLNLWKVCVYYCLNECDVCIIGKFNKELIIAKNPDSSKTNFSPKLPDRIPVQPSHLHNGYTELFPQRSSRCGYKLTLNRSLVSRIRKSGAMAPPPPPIRLHTQGKNYFLLQISTEYFFEQH